MDELLVKVPAPFFGVEDVGFSARHPAQDRHEPLRDVTFFVEGPATPMRVLYERLRLFAEKDHLVEPDGEDELYSWSPPILLTDEVCVMAFRDRSVSVPDSPASPSVARGYAWNLVRPLAFTFLRDSVRLGDLRLSDRIVLVLASGTAAPVDLEVERTAIVPRNGARLLLSA